MTNTIIDRCARYTFSLDGTELTITMRTYSIYGVVYEWRRIRDSFYILLKRILATHTIEKIVWNGDRFSKGVTALIRFDLRRMLRKYSGEDYQVLEVNYMEMFCIDNTLFCGQNTAQDCEDGLAIEIDVPNETQLVICNSSDGTEHTATVTEGRATFSRESFGSGEYAMYAVLPESLPTNLVRVSVNETNKGLVAYFYDDMNRSDLIFRLCRAFKHTENRLSDHIDGYDAI